ncbi:LysR family transcriptional regulator [Pseudomonas psychrophila]|uniref:DNA-binding transcriptional regulator, LysR family n=1 Tax=Pseudomonas psychrophila TaxID=122355 RepID=A0ABY0VYT5_9PSED|nr:LysR family transcriptional regulator [Pseudomonas psychrophila]KAB0489853.1 LysR family transcriptional regulator [Pseudomonas psychrophila]KMN01568.1 LysR family transcriptional regulator [Pseudomonas psychrophila]KOX65320.1 LysR family transcriptional regulator [Pseudomonas psychrophila]QIE35289.1 LysR family transcriptional regulator [Pseudomonas psychrophila]WVI95791.1 LysR family transcriptional regulator [Pseudomonas psychrophila]
MQISDVEVFSAIAESGSLSAAARRLGLSPMTVSRRLATLEGELGVRLFHRTTRSVSLTAEGETFLPFATTLLEASEGARVSLKSNAGTASGVLKVTAPSVFGQSVIMPLIPDLLAEHPALRVDLTLSDSIVDIVGLGIDVAIRIATLRDSALIARPLAPNPRVLCASPAYLKYHGIPATMDALSGHRRIALHGMPYWPFMRDGDAVAIRAEGVFSANSVEAVRAASRQGLGVAMLTYWDVRDDLDAGTLRLIELQDVSPEQLYITAILPTRQHVPHRVGVFLERLESVLGTNGCLPL